MTSTRLPPAVVRPIFRMLDALFLMAQGITKSLGMVSDATVPPVSDDGRDALLPRHPGKWPELRVRLPEGAVYWYSGESIFRRVALWRVPAPVGEVEAAVRAAAAEAWPEVKERRRSGRVLELSFEAGGLRNLIKLTTLPDGGAAVSIGQKIGRIHFDEAECALTSCRQG